MNTQQFFIIMLIVVIGIISISFFSVQSPTGFMPLNDLTEYSSQTLLVSSDRYVNPNDLRTIIKEDTSAQVNIFTGDINDLLPLENDNILSVGWNKLIGFPSGCASGQAVTTISGVLTCSPFLTSFSETDPYYNADKSSIVFENDNISRLINDANYITSADIPSFSDTNFETAGYDFDDYVTWSNGSNDLNLFDNNIFANCYYLSDNNYFCGFNDLPIPAFDLSAYAKLLDFNQNIDVNSLTANFVNFNYLETDYSQIYVNDAGSSSVNGTYNLFYDEFIIAYGYGYRVYGYSDFILEIYYNWSGSEWVLDYAYIYDTIDYFYWYYSYDLIEWFSDYGDAPSPNTNFDTFISSKQVNAQSFFDLETGANNGTTAFNWGNHATQGYLTSFSETDPVWNSEKSSYALLTGATFTGDVNADNIRSSNSIYSNTNIFAQGMELNPTPYFDYSPDNDPWTKGSGWTYVTTPEIGIAHSGGSTFGFRLTNGRVYPDGFKLVLKNGVDYEFEFDVVYYDAGNLFPYVGSTLGTDINSVGHYKQVLTSASSGYITELGFKVSSGTTGVNVIIQNVFVRDLSSGKIIYSNSLSKKELQTNGTYNYINLIDKDNNFYGNYFHGIDFITSSKVPDVTDGKKALDNLNNIDLWLKDDAITGKKIIDYKEHYSHVQKQIETITYIPTEIDINSCNFDVTLKDCVITKKIIDIPVKSIELIDGLSMETRVMDGEKRDWELLELIKTIQVQLVDFLNRLTGAENKIKILEEENILIKSELCKQNDKYSWCVIK